MRGNFRKQAGTLQSIYKNGRRQERKIRIMVLKSYFGGGLGETSAYITTEVLYPDVIYTLQTFPRQGQQRRRCFFRQTEVCGRSKTTTEALHPCKFPDRRDTSSKSGIEPEEVKAAARWKKNSFLVAAIVDSKAVILSPSNHQPNKV